MINRLHNELASLSAFPSQFILLTFRVTPLCQCRMKTRLVNCIHRDQAPQRSGSGKLDVSDNEEPSSDINKLYVCFNPYGFHSVWQEVSLKTVVKKSKLLALSDISFE